MVFKPRNSESDKTFVYLQMFYFLFRFPFDLSEEHDHKRAGTQPHRPPFHSSSVHSFIISHEAKNERMVLYKRGYWCIQPKHIIWTRQTNIKHIPATNGVGTTKRSSVDPPCV